MWAGESLMKQRKTRLGMMGKVPAPAFAGRPGFTLKAEWASCTMPSAEMRAAGSAETAFLPPPVAAGLPRRTLRPNGELTRLKLERTYEVQHLRLAAARLASVQLRDGSIYSNLRTLVPVVVLAGVWTWVNRGELGNLHRFLNRSVGVRHLLLAVLIGTLWNAWLVLGQFSGRDLEAAVPGRGGAPWRWLLCCAVCCRWSKVLRAGCTGRGCCWAG